MVKQNKEFPRITISSIVNHAIRSRYGIKWNARVVRQSRRIKRIDYGTVDYAVPCFELASILKISAEIVGVEIAHTINSSEALLGRFDTNSISGYVNFSLTSRQVEDSYILLKSWLNNPSIIDDHTNQDIIVFSNFVNDPGLVTIEDFVAINLQYLYSSLHKKGEIKYAIFDSNESALDYYYNRLLSTQIDGSDHSTILENRKLYKHLKLSLSNPLIENTDKYSRELLTIGKEWLVQRKLKILSTGINEKNLISQSELITRVNSYFNELVRDISNQKIILDEASKAIYYLSSNDTAVPIRSVDGFLYDESYIIYILKKVLADINNQNKTVVVCAPIWSKEFLADYKKNHNELIQNSKTQHFYPIVSKADIDELRHKLGDETAASLISLMQGLPEALPADKFIRQDLLALIDFPLDLSESLVNGQMPILFDLMNHTADLLAKFSPLT